MDVVHDGRRRTHPRGMANVSKESDRLTAWLQRHPVIAPACALALGTGLLVTVIMGRGRHTVSLALPSWVPQTPAAATLTIEDIRLAWMTPLLLAPFVILAATAGLAAWSRTAKTLHSLVRLFVLAAAGLALARPTLSIPRRDLQWLLWSMGRRV